MAGSMRELVGEVLVRKLCCLFLRVAFLIFKGIFALVVDVERMVSLSVSYINDNSSEYYIISFGTHRDKPKSQSLGMQL